MSDSLAERYFTQVLKPLIGEPMLPGLTSLSVAFRITLPAGRWRVELVHGVLASVQRDEGGEWECEYVLEDDVFGQIVRGQVSPKKAFFSGKTAIHGNLLTGLKVATLMEQFFRTHPIEA